MDSFSPKLGLVLTPFENVNIFANKGTGFRAPAVWELSPVGSLTNFDLDVAEIDSWDVGFNAFLFGRLYVGFDYYHTELQREISYNPDTRSYENLGDSERSGYDLEARLHLPYNFKLYGSYGYVRARLENPSTPGAVYLRRLPEDIITVGVEWAKTFDPKRKLGINAYYIRHGERAFDTKGTVWGDPVDRYYAKVSYFCHPWVISLEGQHNPHDDVSEWMLYSNGRISYDPHPEWQALAKLEFHF
jgi:outer membrane receptor protein involved in Fe transport